MPYASVNQALKCNIAIRKKYENCWYCFTTTVINFRQKFASIFLRAIFTYHHSSVHHTIPRKGHIGRIISAIFRETVLHTTKIDTTNITTFHGFLFFSVLILSILTDVVFSSRSKLLRGRPIIGWIKPFRQCF